jgi:hypothetical protein
MSFIRMDDGAIANASKSLTYISYYESAPKDYPSLG